VSTTILASSSHFFFLPNFAAAVSEGDETAEPSPSRLSELTSDITVKIFPDLSNWLDLIEGACLAIAS